MKRIFGFSAAILMLVSATWAATAPKKEGIRPAWWPGEGPAVEKKQHTLSGKVTNVSLVAIAIQTKQGVVGFTVNSETKVKVEGELAQIGDVQVGDPANVYYTAASDGTRIAKSVVVPKPWFGGKITAAGSDSLTIQSKDKTWNAVLSSGVRIACRGYVGTLEDLRVGYFASVQGVPNGDIIPAAVVRFRAPIIKGVVVEVNGYQATVKTLKGKTVTVTASDATSVLIRPRVGKNYKGTLSDVKPGAAVNIGGHVMGEQTMNALWIDVLTTQTATQKEQGMRINQKMRK